jgi:hypothetical protein
MRLKRWESPRKEGRNDKGRGGSARKRQLKKQRQMLRQKLKQADPGNNNQNQNKNYRKGEEKILPLFLWVLSYQLRQRPWEGLSFADWSLLPCNKD